MKKNSLKSHKGEKHLIWGFFFILVLMQAVTLLVFTQMSSVNQEIGQSLIKQREKAVNVSLMRNAMGNRQVGLRDMVIQSDPFLKDEAWQIFFNSAADFITARQRLQKLGLSDEERMVLSRLNEKAAAAYITQQAVVEMVQNGAGVEEVSPLLQKAIDSQHEAGIEMATLIEMQEVSAEQALKRSELRYDNTLLILSVVAVVAGISAIIIAGLALARDRKLAMELEGHRYHLEDLVSERTQELERMVRELEGFSHSLAHDIRQPLRGLDGFSLILMQDYGEKLDDTGKEYLRRIRAGSQRIGHLLEGMLKLTNLSRKKLQRGKVDISALVREIKEQHEEYFGNRSVDWKIADNMRTDADPGLVRIALENLISNSLKFTSKKDHAVIEFGILQQPGENVFFIRDNGAGFEMRHAKKLFGVFERLHRADEFEGSGIGLATVARIIERHKGKIWAEAEPGKGASFFFTLSSGLQTI